MDRFFKILSLFLLIICFAFQPQGGYDTTTKIKAVFMYNFSKYIEWPSDYTSGNFIIGIYGKSPLYDELVTMSQRKKAGNQDFEIKKINSVNEISKCHIIYMAPEKSFDLDNVIKQTKNYSTLIVGEKEGLAQKGTGINFVIRENKQKFELNVNNIEKKKLKVSSNLEALAIIIK